jgi:hypothetical protein
MYPADHINGFAGKPNGFEKNILPGLFNSLSGRGIESALKTWHRSCGAKPQPPAGIVGILPAVETKLVALRETVYLTVVLKLGSSTSRFTEHAVM